MDTSRLCAICHASLPSDAPKGLCPHCLLHPVGGSGDERGSSGGPPAKDAAPGLPPETRIFGDYELLGEIAVGGMGVVHGARQLSLHRTVALKMIRSGELATPEEVRRFRAEAEAAANLDHPNIVPIYEVGEHEGRHFFSMKLIEGGNLAEVSAACAARDSTWMRRVARWVAQVADAVHHAHQRGLLHRDIKPTNILIDERGEPHLTDFGLAKWVGRSRTATLTQAIVGTPYYMAPEQAQGNNRQVTTAADLYSLGAVLYELLTGQPPFQGDSPLAVLQQVREREPQSPRALNSRMDRDLETICLKCLEKEPPARYASARELAADLERWLEDKPIRARPAGRTERLLKWTRRNPVVASLAAAALLILGAGVGGVLSQWHRAESNATRAQTSANESRERLVRLNVANGVRLLDEGDHFGSLVWFGEALKLVRHHANDESNHRLRLASVIRQSPQLLQVWAPGGPVHAAEFSRDGQSVLAASGRNTVCVWRTDDGAEVARFTHPGGETVAGHLSVDGKQAFTVNGNEVRLWSVTSGELLLTITHESAGHAALSASGAVLATAGDDGVIRLWNPRNHSNATSLVQLQCSNAVAGVSFSADDTRLLGFDKGGFIHVWDVVAQRPSVAPWKVKGGLRHVEFNFDASRVVTAQADGLAQIWDAHTGQRVVSSAKESTWLTCARFSPDGKRLVTTAGGHVARIHNAETGREVAQLSGHKNVVVSGAFSPNGKRVVTCSFDGTARIYDASGRSVAPPLWHGGLVTAASFHPDGERVLTASADGTVKLWSTRPVPPIGLPWGNEKLRIVNASRDGTALILQSTSGVARVWDTRTWKPGSAALSLTNALLKAWLSQDAQRMLGVALAEKAGAYAFDIKTWDLADGNLRTSVSPDCTASDWIYPSSDLKQFVLFGGRRAEVFDAATGQRMLPALTFTQRVSVVQFSPDSRRLLVVTEKSAHVFDLATGHLCFPSLVHGYPIHDAEFSGDGRHLVTACLDQSLSPRVAQVWDGETGRAVGQPLRHADGILRAAFSPDGRAVVTASEDDTARLWSAATGDPLIPPLRHSVAVYDAAFSADGRWIATSSQDRSARVWDAQTGEPLTPSLKHQSRVDQAVFLSEGRCLLTRSGFFVLKLWELPTDSRPLDDLVRYAELLSGHHLDATGALVPLDLPTIKAHWSFLHARYPRDFAPAGRRPSSEAP